MASKNEINKISFLAIIFLTSFIVSCQNNSVSINNKENAKSNTMKKYEWTTSGQADRFYPAFLHKGNFIYEGGEASVPGNRRLGKGWGESGSTHISGEEFKPLPYAFSVAWISLAEKKYFKGTFELPKDTIVSLFQKGFIDSYGENGTYDEFKLCVAPGGVVVVWIAGIGRTTEIGRYQATEAEITIEEIMPDSSYESVENYCDKAYEYVSEEIGNINWDTIPYGRWDDYRVKYKWEPKFIFKDESVILTEVAGEFINGEDYYVIVPNSIIQNPNGQAIPKHYKLEWKNGNEDYFGSRIYFDEEELKIAFNKLFEDKETLNIDLFFSVDKYNSDISIILKSDSDSIPITNSKIRIYETSN